MEKKYFKSALCILQSKGAHIRKSCHVFISTVLILLLSLMVSCSSMDEITLPTHSSYSLLDTLKLNVPYVPAKVDYSGGTIVASLLVDDGVCVSFDQYLMRIPITGDSVSKRMVYLMQFSYFNGVIISANIYKGDIISMWIGRRNEKRYGLTHKFLAMQGAREDDPEYRFYELIDAKTRDSLIVPGHMFVFHKRVARSERRTIAVRKVKFDFSHSSVEIVSNGDTTYTIHSNLHHQPALVYALKACEKYNYVIDLTCNPLNNSILTLSLCPVWIQTQWDWEQRRLHFEKESMYTRGGNSMSELSPAQMNELVAFLMSKCINNREKGSNQRLLHTHV